MWGQGDKFISPREWRGATEIAKQSNAGFGGLMKRIGTTSSGNIMVEMTPREWVRTNKKLSAIENLPSLIKQYRQDKNVSQNALARELGISRNTVSAVEQGQQVSPYTIERILSLIAGESKPEVGDLEDKLPNFGKKSSRPKPKGQRKGPK